MRKLVDKFGRIHDYLRISITENCNFRCTYCMPDEILQLSPQRFQMTADEIFELASTFKSLGTKKIRLTGGEPLMRKDFPEIISKLSKLNLELHITSNGLLLDRHLDVLLKANLKGINISIDSLKNDRFKQITKRDYLDKVLSNIKLATESGLKTKLNVVAMKDINEDEIIDFAQFAFDHNLHIRFIEFMPFGGNNWDISQIIDREKILKILSRKFELSPVDKAAADTSQDFTTDGSLGKIGIISSVTNPFCEGCNRLRLTADGKLKNCLFGTDEIDVLTPLRNKENIEHLLFQSVESKHHSRGGHVAFQDQNASNEFDQNRSMIKIGG